MSPRSIVSSAVRGGIVVTAALLAACGSDSSPAGPSQQPTSSVITITAAGINPNTLTVAAGAMVTFVNQDSVNHDIASNPHPTHTDCPEINQIRSLAPGQSKQTGAFGAGRSCGFHDHSQPTNASLRGTITVR
jgi:plastocyanin